MKKLLLALALLALAAPAYGQAINASGKVSVNTPANDVVSGPTAFTGTGTLAVNSQGSGSVGIQASGTGTGLAFSFSGTVDNTNWFAIPCVVAGTSGSIVTSATANGLWTCQSAGYQQVRVNLTAITGGTETFTLNASAGSSQPPVGIQGTSANITGINGTAPTGGTTGQLPVNNLPTTAGGLSVFFVQPTASDNHANIKNGAGQVYKISITNNSATVNYIRLYNAGTGFNGCNSATNLVYANAIPASTTVGGLADSWDLGFAFTTGISICITGGYATNDTTAATATAMNVNIGYK